MSIPFEIFGILLCMLAIAFFSGIETGIISLNRHRLFHLVREGSRRARIIEGYLHETQRLLGTTLVGTNLNLVICSTLAANMVRDQTPWIRTITTFSLSILILIFCEFFPKIWFNSRPIQRCLPLAPLLKVSEQILKPITTFILILTNWVTTADSKKRNNPFITRDAIQKLVRDSQAGGQISAFEHMMISRVLDLQIRTSRQVMTPLDHMAHVHGNHNLDICFQRALSSGHMRLPVFDPDDRECIGVLPILEILSRAHMLPPDITAAKLMHPPFFVSANMPADDLLPLMRRHRQPLAIVRDEDQKILGLVTQENVLAAIMGGIPVNGGNGRK